MTNHLKQFPYFYRKIKVMKYSFSLMLLLVLSACQTIKIKGDEYKVSVRPIELGSIGQSASFFKNNFEIKALPKLENEIRLVIEVLPFTKKVDKIYRSKARFNQSQPQVLFADSLSLKPEMVTIQLLDRMGFIKELNADHNKEVFRFLYDTKKSKVISGVALNLPVDEILKIRQADTYYLNNSQEGKYIISLYKQGKKIGVLDIGSGTIIAHKLSKFCWSEGPKGKWYIADMTDDDCLGTTKSHPKKRKNSRNLYKL